MQRNINLSDLEKIILNKIHDHISRNEKVGINTVAQECFVSKSAIIKLSKKFGYSGYSEMYYTILASTNHALKLDFSDNIVDTYKSDSLTIHINMLVELLREYREKRIYIDSLGFCDSAKEYYLQKLLSFGFDAASSYHYEAFNKNKSGLYFFLSYSGVRSEILEKVNVAIENNFKVVAFTSTKDSPLGKIAHMTIEVAGIKSDKEHYIPNFFTSNLIILLELVLSKYSNKYLSPKKTSTYELN
ncbi:DNA-binding MurR/RpiR family transcriptional regulator [Clostridium saccharoperbutylacetonicum]|uniref:Transcriptional regulator, RpiR family n=1 Tax=Clostridium saccharoperbutylacetonicum N1-4(HMT) TaxID=931276 RepID=M1MNB9_9CLOT|nr:MurR/RpiR family transcriptional regulator [Clostridium saccharoperbutylacetonicum]AGF59374.1 transcriptional regulator, RpiR family [Clostridium saccharoperbutylacetonicum N1-4(HMT)]NRT59835.1 DNA-binding MurR/RpiR family transcriptional regulator [Clostridium saccharoperbutylacetonicum]NSB23147.1 DNA-binding MurR/RpiR family transcriptional regulator [Clostridium saccharoperbutylacetonicum]NSB42518.1 DNA-binding MurR/RpiR family transcriptional regulator [Clostridium saccharoperbutylaceton